MAPQYLTPGVYVEEFPSGPPPIQRSSTDVTAFIGAAERGPVERPRSVFGPGDFERDFGQVDGWPLAQAVHLFFLNGGTRAVVMRVTNDAKTARAALPAGAGQIKLDASNPGAWGNRLRARVGHAQTSDPLSFNLRLELQDADGITERAEVHTALSIDPRSPRYLGDVLASRSALARLAADASDAPAARPDASNSEDGGAPTPFSGGCDGAAISDAQVSGPELAGRRGGIWALDAAGPVNLLCIPPFSQTQDVGATTWATALVYCQQNRIFLLIDPPAAWRTVADVRNGLPQLNVYDANAATYWPRILVPAAHAGGAPETLAPGGAVAGVYARTDSARGVWKAPAGTRAQVRGAVGLATPMSDQDQEILQSVSVNALRTFDQLGTVVWGARTLAAGTGGNRYVPVQRTALFLEDSVRRGLRWTTFESNGEALWAQVRSSLTEFLWSLFMDGAFQGETADQAFFVNCGRDTHTADDRRQGRLNMLLGFAILKPAEFELLRIELSVQAG